MLRGGLILSPTLPNNWAKTDNNHEKIPLVPSSTGTSIYQVKNDGFVDIQGGPKKNWDLGISECSFIFLVPLKV